MELIVDIDIERCKGCRLCIDVCPKHILVMSQELNLTGAHFASVTSQNDCIGCLQCAIICPEAAITIEQYDNIKNRNNG